ncbi:hypothetical protein TSHO111613_23125 [Tsukamurella hominis]
MTQGGGELYVEEGSASGLATAWQARFTAGAASVAAGTPPAPADASAASAALAVGLAEHVAGLGSGASAAGGRAAEQASAAVAGVQTVVSTDARNVGTVTAPPTPAG